ncbi:hypothetical protein C8F01DRAFT_1130877 [Mycena amicta]|nr:hypothetical protein C8F01DRAFT_1130877 [Mycena amicta]
MSTDTSLLDLPNELILLISESLRDDALLALASSCQRTNQLLISTLFQRVNLSPHFLESGSIASISFKGDDILVLQALAVARCITSVQHISCDLYSARVISTWQNYLLALAALTTLARRLEHLGAVEFNPYFITTRTEDEVGQCVHTMVRFVNAIAQRDDCALTVFGTNDDRSGGGGPFVHTIQQVVRGQNVTVFTISFRFPPLLRTLVNKLTNLFSLPRRLLHPPSPPPPRFYTPPLPPPQTETSFTSSPRISTHSTSLLLTLPSPSVLRLTTLNLHSSYLLRAHFLPYTTDLINTAPLHTLSIGGGVSFETARELELAHYDWALILPALSLSQLTTLRIGSGVDVAVPDLMAFITRHETTIRTLDLRWHCPRGALDAAPAALLPALRSLRATPEYILHFLASASNSVQQEAERAHEHLQAVIITSDDVSVYGLATFARLVAFLETQYASRANPPVVDVFGKMQAEMKLGTVKLPVWVQPRSDET